MPIHDELIRALTEPNENNEIPLLRITRTKAINYSTHLLIDEKMCPDLVIDYHRSREPGEVILIEVESDDDFNYQRSMIQIRKYKRKYPDVRVIIPEEYERFARLYDNDGFTVYLWTASRICKCRCEHVFSSKQWRPRCPKCNSTEIRLKGIKGLEISEWNIPREMMKKVIHRKK